MCVFWLLKKEYNCKPQTDLLVTHVLMLIKIISCLFFSYRIFPNDHMNLY
jgi:hypothetical protein